VKKHRPMWTRHNTPQVPFQPEERLSARSVFDSARSDESVT